MVKPQHRPFHAHRITSLIALVLLFTSFLLLLLVGISLTIIKAIYIIRVYSTADNGQPATSIATELRFGVWGLCASSALDEPSWFTNDGTCYGPKLGYNPPSAITDILGLDATLVQGVLKGLLTVLILHLVAAGFSLCALIPSMFLASHSFTIASLVFAIITALFSTIVFAIDLAVVIVVKNQLPNLGSSIKLAADFGNGVWMVLTAVILTWAAVILLSARACYCCGIRRQPRKF
ncbi:actin cortical patch SUR7/pH-response regulator pali [Mucidula mucida]|nr:actin cortical patch SUR7/pH-response regulator pali [Mucidula mucida]